MYGLEFSRKGPTQICIFEGTMDATLYTNILHDTLLPFLNKIYPEHHRFMQDNDPKHTSGGFLIKIKSLGGKLLQSHQISIPSKICGTK